MSIYYNVVYQGKILEGFDFEAAKNKLIENFALSKEKAEKVLRSRRVVLKKTVDEMTARKLGSALKRVGLDVILTKGRTTAADQPVTVGSGPETGPRVDKIAATPAAALDRQSDIAASAAAVEQTPAPKMAVIPFEFRGSGREYFKIWLVNIILTILTLGIYSAWAKVRHKKYIYGSARLNGAGFEYLADPVKILKGRMIAAVFLVLYSILSNLFPQIGFIFSLVLFAAVPWIVVCALAFNARNSALRNIRFGFSGRIKDAAKTFVLWPILVPLTLGILAPYAYYRQRKFIVENSSYGTTRFAFSATARDYYRLFLSASVPFIIGVGLVAAVIFFLPPLAVPAALA
ncbi:MAG: YjgN family protein, partial [Desulfobacterales bacterium]